jgi:hypothetical protein
MPDTITPEAVKLLFAYFNLPVKQYVEALSQVKKVGLSSDDKTWIEAEIPPVHASTILRQISQV